MSRDGERVLVAAASQLPPGGRLAVRAFGTEIAIFNLGDDLVAVDGRCPHHGGPLCHGRISGTLLPSRPYEYRYGLDGRVLTCPWHGWQFDLDTGASLFDRLVRVPMYRVEVDGDQVVLYDAEPESRSADG